MNNLRERCKEAGISQAELARRIMRSASYISRIAAGKRTPTAKMEAKIEKALRGRGTIYEPPEIPFENERQEKALKRIWADRGYGKE